MRTLERRVEALERAFAPRHPSTEDWIVKLGIVGGIRTGSPETDEFFTKLSLQRSSADQQTTLERAMKRRNRKPSYTAAEMTALKAFEDGLEFLSDL